MELKRIRYVIGPDGNVLTIADLPSPSTKRWVVRRKAEVVAAVKGGLLDIDIALTRYALSNEEYRAWESASEQYTAARRSDKPSITQVAFEKARQPLYDRIRCSIVSQGTVRR